MAVNTTPVLFVSVTIARDMGLWSELSTCPLTPTDAAVTTGHTISECAWATIISVVVVVVTKPVKSVTVAVTVTCRALTVILPGPVICSLTTILVVVVVDVTPGTTTVALD